jgi:hypothetical protein
MEFTDPERAPAGRGHIAPKLSYIRFYWLAVRVSSISMTGLVDQFPLLAREIAREARLGR